jgi:hypothetical protein
MTLPTRSRTIYALTALIGCFAALTLGLAGCQSEQEQRIAEAKELIRQRQTLQAVSGQTAHVVTPAQPVPPANNTRPDDPGMPVYPNAKEVKLGSRQSEGLGDGLAMSMLETGDSVDAVISFYSERLKTPGSHLQPDRTEDRLDGRRVVRLTVPRDDGGLMTVEARDEPGKTTIQLMNMKGTPRGAVPPGIPGIPGIPGSGTATGSPTMIQGSSKNLPPMNPEASSPRDLTAPPVASPARAAGGSLRR